MTLVEACQCAIFVQQIGWVVACVAVANVAGTNVRHGEKDRDEHARRIVGAQLIIDSREYTRR